ncbi:MAG: proton-conducting transporter membrane subunit [Gemmataceae bacterium]
MPEQPLALTLLGAVVVIAPILLVALLGLTSLVSWKLSERATAWAVYLTTLVALIGTVGVFVLMLAWDTRHVVISFGDWVHVGPDEAHTIYHFGVKVVFDRLSVPFVALILVLCGTIGAFANRYMHRERGYNRFFVLYSIFMAGMVTASLAGTIETLFAGWEMVGLSSALLVGFFHERQAPVQNGLRVWAVYRISDAALLFAAVVMHHAVSKGDFDLVLGGGPWPEGRSGLTGQQLLFVGAALIIAAAGKSALLPFSGWLPRAMEGPTPSSAVFYGALSVHLGAYLLLRVGPLLDAEPILSISVLVLGLSTAGFAALAGQVQTDVKSALSFASLTQVGLIVAEIGLGWRYIPLVHFLGHACLRTLQFLRASSVLRDQHSLENALGKRLTGPPRKSLDWIPASLRRWVYRFALERGYLDAFLGDYIARPFLNLFRWCDALERRAIRHMDTQSSPVVVEQPASTPEVVEIR